MRGKTQMQPCKVVDNSEGDSSPRLSWKTKCQMGDISLFTSLENNPLKAKLELGDYFLIQPFVFFKKLKRRLMGQSGYYRWEPHAFQTRPWQMAGKPPGSVGTGRGQGQDSETPLHGSCPIVPSGHPGKAFNPLLRSTGQKKEPHHWVVVRSKGTILAANTPEMIKFYSNDSHNY